MPKGDLQKCTIICRHLVTQSLARCAAPFIHARAATAPTSIRTTGSITLRPHGATLTNAAQRAPDFTGARVVRFGI